MAIEHGYDIIPFGSVGPDESFDIVMDYDDMQRTAVWKWASKRFDLDKVTRNGELLPPVARGLGPTMIPRPQRYDFGFGQRISTEHLKGQEPGRELLWQVREEVSSAVEGQIERLLQYRKEDRKQNWSPLRRHLAPIAEDLPDH